MHKSWKGKNAQSESNHIKKKELSMSSVNSTANSAQKDDLEKNGEIITFRKQE